MFGAVLTARLPYRWPIPEWMATCEWGEGDDGTAASTLCGAPPGHCQRTTGSLRWVALPLFLPAHSPTLHPFPLFLPAPPLFTPSPSFCQHAPPLFTHSLTHCQHTTSLYTHPPLPHSHTRPPFPHSHSLIGLHRLTPARHPDGVPNPRGGAGQHSRGDRAGGGASFLPPAVAPPHQGLQVSRSSQSGLGAGSLLGGPRVRLSCLQHLQVKAL